MQKLSPLRYPGGKAQLSKQIADIYDNWRIYDYNYIEPFAGGSAVGLYLLFSERAEYITINDLDYGIYCFWQSVVHNCDKFIERIHNTDANIENWHVCKSIYENGADIDTLEMGFAAFFLNRTNYSGIISGSPIGGFNQKGKYKIDARYNKSNLSDRVRRISQYSSRIKITNMDARNLINESSDLENTVMYVDPPYVKQGSRLYYSNLDQQGHKQIHDALYKCKIPWILTYDKDKSILDLYGKSNCKLQDIKYSARNKRKEKEIIVLQNKTYDKNFM